MLGGTTRVATHLTPTQRKLKFYLDPLANEVVCYFHRIGNEAKEKLRYLSYFLFTIV